MKTNAKITVRGGDAAYTARGVWEARGDGWRLRYDEPAGCGLDGATTVLTFTAGRAVLTRTGAVRCALCFDPAAPHRTSYETPHGSFPAEVVTHTLRARLDARGGLFAARYTLTLGGAAAEHTLNIRIQTEDEG